MVELDLDKTIKVGCVKSVISENFNRKLYGQILGICEEKRSLLETKQLIGQAFKRISGKTDQDLGRLSGIRRD